MGGAVRGTLARLECILYGLCGGTWLELSWLRCCGGRHGELLWMPRSRCICEVKWSLFSSVLLRLIWLAAGVPLIGDDSWRFPSLLSKLLRRDADGEGVGSSPPWGW